MVLNEKGNIKQFNLVIYPIDFVVVIGDLEEEINNLYKAYGDDNNSVWITAPTKTGATYRVVEKETGIPCIMIWIKKKEEFTSSIVAHECGHATLELWLYIGSEVSLSNQEPFCYLLGNLVRLAVGCFYEIPGIKPPVVKHDAFCNPEKPKRDKGNKSKKK